MGSELVVRLFVETEDGLMDHSDPDIERWGGVLPQIGDEIAQSNKWHGGPNDLGQNVSLVVQRRVFIRDEYVVLICKSRRFERRDYDFFP